MTTTPWPLALPIRLGGRRSVAACIAALAAGGLLGAAPVNALAASGGAGAPSSAASPTRTARAPGYGRGPRRARARRAFTSTLPLRQVQRILGVRVDGQWGSRTERALRRWQAHHGLVPTGVTDVATVRSLGLDPWSDPLLPALTAPAPDALTGPPKAVRAELAKIAACESGGDIHQLSYHGTYRGKYQFDMESWFRAGGLVDPAQARESEQDQRATWILATQGRSAWPNCS